MFCIGIATDLWVLQVGNPLLDGYKNRKGHYEFLWNHGVMSDEVWGEITELCHFGPSDGGACHESMESFETGQIDDYNIYAPICLPSPDGEYYSSGYVCTTTYSTSSDPYYLY
jgi:serine carboxypeptidase-like clade 2